MTIIPILQLVTIALLVAGICIWQRNRFIVDIGRVADLMAAQLLADYGQDLWLLQRAGVESYARYKYMQMVTEWGFPSAAVDRVASLAWGVVRAAQGVSDSQPQAVDTKQGNPFYE